MLRVKLGPLATGAIDIAVEVPPNESCFDDLGFDLDDPVTIDGRLTAAGDAQYYLNASIGVRGHTECRRCLQPAGVEQSFELSVLFSEDEEMTDPSVYRIAENSSELDLGEMIREEIILALPGFVLCKENCVGLCQQCGANLNDGECPCGKKPDPRWAALEQLKDTLTDR
jgi:uncharacterized protein